MSFRLNRRKKMKQNKLTFETENLIVHWLKISVEELYDLEEIQALANFFG